MIQNILEHLSSYISSSEKELSTGNWLIGQGQLDGKYIEIRYSTNQHIFTQTLIDDIWHENLIWNHVRGTDNERIALYICHPGIKIELNQVTVDKDHNLSLKFKSTDKHYLSLTDELKEKINLDLSDELTCSIQKRNNSKPLLSVITTVFNNSKLLEQTIQSVINQNCENFEYVIKDAGSADGFEKVIDKYKPFIDKVVVDKDKGIYDGMHQGFLHSKGTYFAYLNSDDIYINNSVLSSYEKSITEYSTDALFADIKILNQETRESINRKGSTTRIYLESSINHPTLFLKRETYLKVGGFDLNLKIAADGDLTIKLLKAKASFYYLDKPVILFRAGGSSYNSKQKLKEDLICRYRYNKFNIIGYLYTLGREVKRKFLT